MSAALLVVLRSLALICGGHRAVALENLALRQQLAVFKRTVPRPPLRPRDRLFWVLLAHAWRNWRSALIVVQPETVVGWHRQWLRRRWTHRSTSGRPGRPRTTTASRTLVNQMGAANPLWGAPRIHGDLRKLGIDRSPRDHRTSHRRMDGATGHRGSFRTTPRRGGSCGIAMPSTGKRSCAVSPAWTFRRSSPVPQALGKTHMRRD